MRNAYSSFPKQTLSWIAIGYTLFVIYGSLVPLELDSRPIETLWQDYWNAYASGWSMSNRTDWFANFLLFIPLTYLWLGLWWRESNRPGNILKSLLLIIASWLLCSAIEFTQLFFKERTTSINDIVAETLGGITGIYLWWSTRHDFSHWYSQLVQKHQANKWLSYVELYVVAMLFYNLMPLDLSLSPVEIYHKWQQNMIRLIPFGGWSGNLFELAFQFVSDVIIWIPLPLLWAKSNKSSSGHIFFKVLLIACAIEFCQLFVLSRYTDTSDIFTAAIGAWLGLKYLQKRGSQSLQSPQLDGLNHLSKGILFTLAWSIVLMLLYWYPFDFTFNREMVDTKLANFFGLLFAPYYAGSEFVAITQIFRKICLAIPLGFGAAYASSKRSNLSFAGSLIYLTPALLILLGIELVQALLPTKVVHQTDLWLGIFGCVLGFKITRQLLPNTNSPEPEVARPNRSVSAFKESVYAAVGYYPWALLLLYIALCVMSLLPQLPYNLKELLHGSFMPIQVLLLVVTLSWICTAPLCAINWLQKEQKKPTFKGVLSIFIGHLVISAILLRLVVPTESLYDIVGYPTWGTMRELELLFRATGLLALVTGTLFVTSYSLVSSRHNSYQFGLVKKQFWAFYLLLVLPWSYFVVVVMAGTDNLTELLRQEGYSLLTLSLPLYFCMLSFLGLSFCFVLQSKQAKWLTYWGLALLLSLPVGYFLVTLGTEPTILKYNRVFSALQFLLSTDRGSYLAEPQLTIRFAIAQLTVIFGLFLVQLQLWKVSPKKEIMTQGKQL